jgi:tetrahydromethanopterin S-methyltransferase subunit G
MDKNPQLVKEDQMEDITKELQRLEIIEKKVELTKGKDQNTIRRMHRRTNYD